MFRMKSCLHVLLLCHVIACKIYQFRSAWTSAACGDIFLLKKKENVPFSSFMTTSQDYDELSKSLLSFENKINVHNYVFSFTGVQDDIYRFS